MSMWSWATLPGASVRVLETLRMDSVTVDRLCAHSPAPCDCDLIHRMYDGWTRTPWLISERKTSEPVVHSRGRNARPRNS